MARIAGRNGRLYANITSGGTPEPIAYLAQFTAEAAADDIEVTAFGDVNKTYVAGLPDFSGSFSGFYDDDSAQLYTAALDGLARKFYLYPSVNTPGQYFFGTATFDFSIDTSVADAVKISGNFKAASAVTKVG